MRHQAHPQPTGGGRFPIKYYLIAMLFIVFDIEIVFLYPWALTFDMLGLFGLVEMLLFIATLLVAYLFVWRRRGLEWDWEDAADGYRREAAERVPAHHRRGSRRLRPQELDGTVTFGLACCAIEMMSTGGANYDLGRFGMEVFRPRRGRLT